MAVLSVSASMAAHWSANCSMMHARMLEDENFQDYKISVKASDVFLTVAAYHALADATDAPLHLGVTEAGGTRIGTVKSSIGMGNLLWAGIGDLACARAASTSSPAPPAPAKALTSSKQYKS